MLYQKKAFKEKIYKNKMKYRYYILPKILTSLHYFIGLLAICLATAETDKKDEIKSKRQIHQARQSQQPSLPRQYIIRAAGQSEQIQEVLIPFPFIFFAYLLID